MTGLKWERRVLEVPLNLETVKTNILPKAGRDPAETIKTLVQQKLEEKAPLNNNEYNDGESKQENEPVRGRNDKDGDQQKDGSADRNDRDLDREKAPIKQFSHRDVHRYKLYKRFGHAGQHSKGVEMLVFGRDYIIKKTYNKTRANIFWNEVYWLLKTKNSGFTPRIVRVEPAKLTFWMTYCGVPVPKAKWRGKIRHGIRTMTQLLLSEYGLYHNDIKEGNITQNRKGQLFLIDFGWTAPYKVKPGYGKGRWGDQHPNCFEEIREDCIKLLLKKPDVTPQPPNKRRN